MRVRLDYGRSGLELELPPEIHAMVVRRPGVVALHDPVGAVRDACARPIGCSPLAELARGRRSAVVVISDRTRPIPYAVVLPPLLDTLEAAGIPRERIEILVATGLHRACTTEELVEMAGSGVVARYRFRNHAARSAEQHRYLGRTTQGTEIVIDRGYLDAELKIVTGLIEPHLMAGYSGGAKGVASGIAATETLRRTHGPVMLEAEVGPGIVAGNPFRADLLEVARSAGVDFLLNVSIDRQRQLTGVFAGDLEQAHAAGIAAVERHVRVDVPAPADVVVTTAGGHPLDLTFYQAIKGPVAALNLIRRGGTVILAASMTEGLGSADFQRLLDRLRAGDDAMTLLTTPGFFCIDQWMVQHLDQVLRQVSLVVVSAGLDGEALRGLPLGRAGRVEDALAAALRRHGPHARVAVIPEGPYVLPTVQGRTLPLGRGAHDAAA
jgi:nickel-dependent lactate racemase